MMINTENSPQHWVNRLSFILRRDLQVRFRRAGFSISAEEWAVLLQLWQVDGQTPGELADKSVKDQTTMTRLLDGLVRKDLVDRVRDNADRRKVRVLLTKKGVGMQNQLLPIAQGLIAQSEHDISNEEREITVRVLKKMAANLLE